MLAHRVPGLLTRFYLVDDFGDMVVAPSLFPYGLE